LKDGRNNRANSHCAFVECVDQGFVFVDGCSSMCVEVELVIFRAAVRRTISWLIQEGVRLLSLSHAKKIPRGTERRGPHVRSRCMCPRRPRVPV
jgi:hypothetical protein